MATDKTDAKLTELERENAKLKASLERCHELLAEYREKAATSADAPASDNDNQSDREKTRMQTER